MIHPILRIRGLPEVGSLLLLSTIWGYNFVVLKQVLAYVDPLVFTALRTVLGALTLFVFASITGRPLPFPRFKSMILLGLLQTAGFGLLIQLALVTGDAGRTVVIVYSMPFWLVTFAAMFLGERLGRVALLAVLGAAVGLVLILQPWAGDAPARLGAMLALLAGAVWAVAAVVARKNPRRDGVSLLALTVWQMLLGGIVLSLFALAMPYQPIVPTAYFWGALIYGSVFATGIAWFLWLFILERMSAGSAGLSTLLVPVIGLIASWIQLGETPDWATAVGMAAIVFSLAVLSMANLGKKEATRD